MDVNILLYLKIKIKFWLGYLIIGLNKTKNLNGAANTTQEDAVSLRDVVLNVQPTPQFDGFTLNQ